MKDLYSANTLSRFWGAGLELPEDTWRAAVEEAAGLLPGQARTLAQNGCDAVVEYILGEGQFGSDHWQLSRARRLYYHLARPFLPRQVRPLLRRLVRSGQRNGFALGWPVEDRYVRFLYAVLEVVQKQHPGLRPASFWPGGARFALVLTHDVETTAGQASVRRLADLEEHLGFRSSFNFVPERYSVDRSLMEELRTRGFEIGVHGLKHDGKLFSSHAEFSRRAKRINHYLKEFGAVGFRAPLTHRHPGWMQELEIEYDLSFFDTDPYEPIPGGAMSVWPFQIGHFIELPYTLVQDYTLTAVLGETTPRIWLQKVDFLERYHGMALLNTHPDYLVAPATWKVYADFLDAMKQRGGYWHALPREVAAWWRARVEAPSPEALQGAGRATARPADGDVTVGLPH